MRNIASFNFVNGTTLLDPAVAATSTGEVLQTIIEERLQQDATVKEQFGCVEKNLVHALSFSLQELLFCANNPVDIVIQDLRYAKAIKIFPEIHRILGTMQRNHKKAGDWADRPYFKNKPLQCAILNVPLADCLFDSIRSDDDLAVHQPTVGSSNAKFQDWETQVPAISSRTLDLYKEESARQEEHLQNFFSLLSNYMTNGHNIHLPSGNQGAVAGHSNVISSGLLLAMNNFHVKKKELSLLTNILKLSCLLHFWLQVCTLSSQKMYFFMNSDLTNPEKPWGDFERLCKVYIPLT
jgi:hypothetical protein